jgi:hypothetical protein
LAVAEAERGGVSGTVLFKGDEAGRGDKVEDVLVTVVVVVFKVVVATPLGFGFGAAEVAADRADATLERNFNEI